MPPVPKMMLKLLLLAIACVGLHTRAQQILAEDSPFRWENIDGDRLELREGDDIVMVFQLQPKSQNGEYSRSNYVHPLYDAAGDMVTEDFPQDHLHHRGIFWAWHQLLLDGKPVADPWLCKDIHWLAPGAEGNWITTRTDSGSAEMKVVRDWSVPRSDRKLEPLHLVRATVAIHVWPTDGETRWLDFDLRLRALVDNVSIGGSDDVKGYGGFSPRVRLSDDVQFFGQTGPVTPEPKSAVDAGAWVNLTRTLDGKKKGIAMMVHPSHPEFPLRWILRPQRSMQNAQWPGREPVALSTEADTRLRYRLVLHDGQLDHEQLEAIWRDFR